MADLLRAFAMFGCGVYVAAKVPVIRHHARTMEWFRRGRLRFDDVAAPLYWRASAHALAKAYIIVDLGTRFGDHLSWRAPAAVGIFLVGLWSLHVTMRSDVQALGSVREDIADGHTNSR